MLDFFIGEKEAFKCYNLMLNILCVT